MAVGRASRIISFAGLSSIDECVEHMRRELSRRELSRGIDHDGADRAVIRADGLNQEAFADKRFPTRRDLDRITTDRPFFATRVCGHIGFCNSKMLEYLGITGGGASSDFLEGAERDADGEPNGILRGSCLAEARDMLPPETESDIRGNIEAAMKTALENGVTAVGTCDIIRAGTFSRVLNAYKSIYATKTPAPRIRLQNGVADDPAYLDDYIKNGFITGKDIADGSFERGFLSMASLKLFADGSLGARTACMRQPYCDDPTTRGVPESDWGLLRKLIAKGHANGFQVIVHAIGDAAVEEVIADFEALGDPQNRLRHGIVHCQITDHALLSRIAKNNILTFVQPIFLADDMRIVERRVGKPLASSSYAWGTMETLGVRASYGTDAPVAPVNPLLGIACAVTRQDQHGFPTAGFYPQERVDVYTAVDNYTYSGAYAHFDEHVLGRIQAGFAADMVLLDTNIFTAPPETIAAARPLWTMVNGELVFER
jgi:predicted amidohydrolase YtcJ